MVQIKKEVKKRKKNTPTEFSKELKKIREYHTPLHTVEIELKVLPLQVWKLIRISEQLRVIRNTVLGQVHKNYIQMVRTKEYRGTLKSYKKITNEIEKVDDKETTKELEKKKMNLKKKFEELHSKYNVTFDFVRNYGTILRNTKYKLPDAVTVLSVCEMVWKSIENIMYGDATKPRFYKKGEIVAIQGKQAERCVILKYDSNMKTFLVSHNGMIFPLIIKEKDLFVQETLSNIKFYMENNLSIDKENVESHLSGKSILSTYRIRNNRIVHKNIRGKARFFVQIVLEGIPVVKRKRDGSFRHTNGKGKIGGDVGTQSIAIVSQDAVILKNLAERSRNTFHYEKKVVVMERYLDRSKRSTNPENFNPYGTIKKGKKEWFFSKRYKKKQRKIKDLHRKASLSRKYAHNEDVNKLRSLGDELIIENMNIKGLQKKAKEVTINEKTGKINRRKRFGKSIGKRSPGYLISQAKYRFSISGGVVREVNTWTFKASQYDHILDDTNKKQLSKRWHELPNGTRIQRDLYSAFLLYCAEKSLEKSNRLKCLEEFEQFYRLHQGCIQKIKNDRQVVLNSGIKLEKIS